VFPACDQQGEQFVDWVMDRWRRHPGIGSDPTSPSLYIRKRGEGELAVRAAFADVIFVRPSVMFGEDD